MAVKIFVFGKLADIVAGKELVVEDVSTVAALRALLEFKYSGLKGLKYAVSVNRKLASDECIVSNDDEVALLPPFSGG